MNNSRSILELSNKEAKIFFMKSESYGNFDLPPYFVFDKLLKTVDEILGKKTLQSKQSEKPSTCENVNYTLFNNKDGKYTWRPIELIHPVIYVDLVNKITQPNHWNTIKNRFAKFRKNRKIKCFSIPVESLSDEKDTAEQVSNWSKKIEQKSIGLALDFDYIFHTDIENCYGSIYTHSITWALHTKDEAKKTENHNNTALIGVAIDKSIQSMSYGQTNGIPQGSVLMDFVAEMVLGYAGIELSAKICDAEITDYFILRYRDDFRVFVNNPQHGEHILKLLTEVMIDLGMKLNPGKTVFSNDVIRSSIKSDKLHWIEKIQTAKSLKNRLLIIHNHAQQFPNSGSLTVGLSNFYKKLLDKKKIKEIKESAIPMISIVVDIARHNPRTYPIVAAILSKLIFFLDGDEDKKLICKKIEKKFQKIPNTGYMEVWLQRLSMFFIDTTSSEDLCQLADKSDAMLWNSDWISCIQLKNCLKNPDIIDHDKKEKMEHVIPYNEVNLYNERYDS